VDDAGLLADEAARAADLSRGHIELEVELDDEDLLGTSTLAKLAAVKPVVAEIVAAEIAPEEIEKPIVKVKATRKKKTAEEPVLDKSDEKKEEDKE